MAARASDEHETGEDRPPSSQYKLGQKIEEMVLADSFVLPDLSDDENDPAPQILKNQSEPEVSGRSVRAAARTKGG
jgi:hypothetical protein